ncbi:MAG: thiamine pyrophosphate-dependent enzyme [Culicoidibacterales bacterium]
MKPQIDVFKAGNQMAAQAAADINYHVMGYFPISPSTEVAQYLDMMGVNGQHDIQLIAADGEHGAAGICYGAATAGARVFNATSANGLMYMLEQLPVQSGTRYPMVMNLVNRAVSGPLNIHCDHSDLYFALNSGWIILTGSNPQHVYDLNIMALKIAEHADVRLPAMVSYDGYITSHQKHNVKVFENAQDVREFVGEMQREGYDFVIPETAPVTIGAHMKGDDFMNNRYQLEVAQTNALRVFEEVAAEYAQLSGRQYDLVETYAMEDAEVALFILNSSADIAKAAVDKMRAEGKKVGLVRPNIVRPFPAEAITNALKDVKVIVMGERADSAGAKGGNLSHDLKAALHDAEMATPVLTRIYGLGGKEFYASDAEAVMTLGFDFLANPTVDKFGYYGVNPGDEEKGKLIQRTLEPRPVTDYVTGKITAAYNEATNKVDVRVPPLRMLTSKPKRLVSGHGACPGCGIFSGLELFFKGIEGEIVIVNHTGCAYVVTAGYPYSSYQQHYVHNLFQSGPATLSGIVEALYEMRHREEINFADSATFVMVSGDGGMDIGMGSAIGTALRGHKLIMLEYDNQGYMNTGAQMSYSTPLGNRTSTTNVGKVRVGKQYGHKDTAQIMAACNMPYVFTGSEAYPLDLVKKAAKAQWYANNVGPVYGKILIACPLNWKSADNDGTNVIKAATDCGFFPLYEVEQGLTTITVDPEAKKRVPVEDWVGYMGKSRHLLKPENEAILTKTKVEIERRYQQLKAKHDSEYL